MIADVIDVMKGRKATSLTHCSVISIECVREEDFRNQVGFGPELLQHTCVLDELKNVLK